MNTSQANQEKRTIKVKDFLDDFRNGLPDTDILKKYHLTPVGLEKFFAMLLERGILAAYEIDERYRPQLETEEPPLELEKSSFICPCCLSSHDTMFDICPNCGVSFQELMSRSVREEEILAGSAAVPVESTSEPEHDAAKTLGDGGDRDPSCPPDAEFVNQVDEIAERPEAAPEFSMQSEALNNDRVEYHDALDEIIPGMPLDYVNDAEPHGSEEKVRCDSCDGAMEPALRDVYDRGRSYLAILLAGACLVLGIVGVTLLSLVGTLSVTRLLVLYGTGLFLLSGVALLTAGSFMYLARERVYYCSYCNRVFPRG